jgi:hypothetical protein
MKSVSCLRLLNLWLCLLPACVSPTPQAQSIHIVSDFPIPGTSTSATSLALSTKGQPLLAYFSGEPDYAISYLSFGGEVERVGIAGNAQRDAVTMSLALNPDGQPGIAYVDDRSGDLIYAERRSGVWGTEMVDVKGRTGYFPSLAYDEQGQPQISYFDHTNNDIKYAVKTARGWRIETIDATGEPGFHIPAGFTRLALSCEPDPDNCARRRPHVAYLAYRYKPYDGELRYATRYDWGWRIETVDSAYAAGGFPSLILDRQSQPWVSYYRVSTWDFDEGELRVAHLDNGHWNVAVIDNQGNAGRSSALALTPSGQPLIAYYAATPGDLRLAWWDGRWRRTTLISDGNRGYRVTLALGGDNLWHLTFVDGDKRLTRLMSLRLEE